MTLALWLELADDLDPGDVPAAARLEDWLQAMWQYLRTAPDAVPAPCRDKPLAVALRVVGEPEGRALNAQYRGRDYATNVLSFPAELPDWLPDELDELPLGDLVICAPVVRAEAADQGKPVDAHWRHLLLHGLLHLLGHDHIEDTDALLMEALEVAALAALGDRNPYEPIAEDPTHVNED